MTFKDGEVANLLMAVGSYSETWTLAGYEWARPIYQNDYLARWGRTIEDALAELRPRISNPKLAATIDFILGRSSILYTVDPVNGLGGTGSVAVRPGSDPNLVGPIYPGSSLYSPTTGTVRASTEQLITGVTPEVYSAFVAANPGPTPPASSSVTDWTGIGIAAAALIGLTLLAAKR